MQLCDCKSKRKINEDLITLITVLGSYSVTNITLDSNNNMVSGLFKSFT
jgi:hypothetical protein